MLAGGREGSNTLTIVITSPVDPSFCNHTRTVVLGDLWTTFISIKSSVGVGIYVSGSLEILPTVGLLSRIHVRPTLSSPIGHSSIPLGIRTSSDPGLGYTRKHRVLCRSLSGLVAGKCRVLQPPPPRGAPDSGPKKAESFQLTDLQHLRCIKSPRTGTAEPHT